MMRITATKIADWANTKVAQADLPRLIRRLCFDAGTIRHIAFPAGDSTYKPGWDGTLYSEHGNTWVPAGASCWEMGCDKNITSKANGDYLKRIPQFNEEERHKTTFVFITPRRWSSKSEWIAAHRKKAEWLDVLAFDADDLEQWLEQTPAVALAFAEELGLTGWGVESPARYWQLWSQQCSPAISPDAFFIDRNETQNKLLETFTEALHQDTSRTLVIHADSQEEATAFATATILQQSELASSTLIVTNSEGWRFVEINPQLRIAIAASTEIAKMKSQRDGLLVIVPHATGDFASETNGDSVTLDRPNIYDFEKALSSIGVEESDANRYALTTGRSWSVFRRQCAINPAIRHPAWLEIPQAASLSTLCLLGTWSENTEADRNIVSQVAGKDYEEIDQDLRELSRHNDSPVLKIGVVWKAKSPLELLHLFGGNITRGQLDRFFQIAYEMLAAPDPQLELPDEKRYAAQVYGKARPHSGLVIESLCDTLIKLAVRGPEQPSLRALDIEGRVTLLIRRLLDGADSNRWLSLASYLPALAEAAPDAFLGAIEKSLLQTDASVTKLLTATSDSRSFSGRCWHSGLLWALERLAWSPKRLARVALILANLCHAPIKGNWGNKPKNSLFDLFRTWLPQTSADIQQRIQVVDLLLVKEPDIAFDLLDRLTAQGLDSASPTARPKWRDDDAGAGYRVTNAERIQMYQAARNRLLVCSVGNSRRIAKLVENSDWSDSTELVKVLNLAEPFTQPSATDEERETIRSSLRQCIHWHRNYNDIQGEALDALLAPAEHLYDRLTPTDIIIRHCWLFQDHWPDLPVRTRDEGSERGEMLQVARSSALNEIFQISEVHGIERMIHECGNAYAIGSTLAQTQLTSEQWAEWIANNGSSLEKKEPMALCISGLLHWLPEPDSTALVKKVLEHPGVCDWNHDKRARFLTLARLERSIWELVDASGDDIYCVYWNSIEPGFIRLGSDDLGYLLRKLLEANRPRTALSCCQYDLQQTDAKLLLELMTRFLHGEEPNGTLPDAWRLGKMIERLEKSGEVEKIALIQLEFGLFPALRYGEESKATLLYESIMSDPALFTELICILYKPAHGEREEVLSDAAASAAGTAWDILHNCTRQPGTLPDGSIDHDLFTCFINETRELCKQADRLDSCDRTLGQILAYAPADEEGTWPFAPAREALEPLGMVEMRSGFWRGTINKRGVTSRSPWDGGEQERELAAYYRGHADKLHQSHSNVAHLLEEIANGYDRDGHREDVEADLRKEGY